MTADELMTAIATQAENTRSQADGVLGDLLGAIGQLRSSYAISIPAWDGGTVVKDFGTINTSPAPGFSASYALQQVIPDLPQVQQEMLNAYDRADSVTKAKIDSGIGEWMDRYAPGFVALNQQFDTLLLDGANGLEPALEGFGEELWAGLRQRVDKATRASQREAYVSARRRGAKIAQTSTLAALNRIQSAAQDQLAEGATTIYIELFDYRLKYKEFCIQQQTGLRQMVYGSMLQLGGILLNMRQQILAEGTAFSGAAVQGFDAGVKGYELELRRAAEAVLNPINISEQQLKIWLGGLEGELSKRKGYIENIMAMIKEKEIPYKGTLERNLKQAELQLSANQSAVGGLQGATSAYAQIVAAAISQMLAIGTHGTTD